MVKFIVFLFTICVGLMTGLGNMLHVSYKTINVILFCYVEPILTVLMVVLAIHALCKVPIQGFGIWTFRVVVSVVFLFLMAGGVYFVFQVIATEYGLYNEPYLHMPYPTSVHMANLFDRTVDWLKVTAGKLGTTYEAINIIVYVLVMPVLSLASYGIMRCTMR
ncbi:MAG: hypothetical protein J5917_05825 [Bacteroidales bacterium]|nr:hypothetical protein [Bacteroidales bacterium]MBP3235614.1 hypothetical protein [Bacteroidales bacterium]